MLDQTHRLAFELARLVVERDDGVAPRVAAVVDDDGVLRVGRGEVDSGRLEHELRDPACRSVELEQQVLVLEPRVARGGGVPLHRALADPVHAVTEGGTSTGNASRARSRSSSSATA